MAARKEVMAMTLLCLLILATNADWVDYPSGMRCCSKIPVEECDPESPLANNACRDVCHYGGCRKGGQCEYMGWGVGRVCYCNC